MSGMASDRLSWAPLDAYVTRWVHDRGMESANGVDRLTRAKADVMNVTKQTVLRWDSQGWLPVDTGDKVATQFGLNPVAIWGEEWTSGWDEPDEPDEVELFRWVWEQVDPSVMCGLRAAAYGVSCRLRDELAVAA